MTKGTPGPHPRRAGRRAARYHHGNLREALVRAALRLVASVGPAGLTLRAAARMVGVSSAAPYRHFGSKEALLAAVSEQGFRALAAAMRRAAAQHRRDPAAAFAACGLAYIRFATGHPSHFRVMFGPEVSDRSAYPALREAADEAFRLLVEMVRNCQRTRVVKEADPKELALSAWSVVHGLSALAVDRQLSGLYPASFDEMAQTVTRHLSLGLAPRS